MNTECKHPPNRIRSNVVNCVVDGTLLQAICCDCGELWTKVLKPPQKEFFYYAAILPLGKG